MLTGLIRFFEFIVMNLLNLTIWAIVISAVIGWLVAFDIINLRNVYLSRIAYFLDAVTRPILRPFQRFVPVLGGVDISPLVALIVLIGLQKILLPAMFGALKTLAVGL